ncbi:hypothetical protein GC102_11735 [Paenibacillus sp. LMG 31460]|uniref:Uncharacterized protein n=1 Tax=Paenibacillus germinis TaxID=2654979 RepID=A0ABX1YZM5_9BACL|nr:hypothetical protein [Paenibacillus germinis]NOU86437.1 hypothetical protein [Paenibacillus germinis]
MMKNIRNLFFSSVLIVFIGWCMYFYLQEISSKLLVHPQLYTFTILEMLLAAMGAFYMVIMVVMSIGHLFVMVVKKIKA